MTAGSHKRRKGGKSVGRLSSQYLDHKQTNTNTSFWNHKLVTTFIIILCLAS